MRAHRNSVIPAEGGWPSLCPACESENLSGADTCANCGADVSFLSQPAPRSTIEASIITESLERLHPSEPVIVPPDATVAQAIAELCRHNIGCVLVGTPDHIVGIFSERDVLLRVAEIYDQAAALAVAEFMTPDPDMLDIAAPIAYALNRMSVGDYRHVPVTRGGVVVGVISVRDLLAFLDEEYPGLLSETPGG